MTNERQFVRFCQSLLFHHLITSDDFIVYMRNPIDKCYWTRALRWRGYVSNDAILMEKQPRKDLFFKDLSWYSVPHVWAETISLSQRIKNNQKSGVNEWEWQNGSLQLNGYYVDVAEYKTTRSPTNHWITDICHSFVQRKCLRLCPPRAKNFRHWCQQSVLFCPNQTACKWWRSKL